MGKAGAEVAGGGGGFKKPVDGPAKAGGGGRALEEVLGVAVAGADVCRSSVICSSYGHEMNCRNS